MEAKLCESKSALDLILNINFGEDHSYLRDAKCFKLLIL
jgi:hypothetical protein